jgi:hypothetical protein
VVYVCIDYEMCPKSPSRNYRLELVTPKSHGKRGVAFLISEEDRRITAKPAFDGLENTAERGLRTRFDAWVGGQPPKSHRYHGWDRSEFGGRYTKCFVFKYTAGPWGHHLYGFLCHPKAPHNARYEVCVLVSYVRKRQSDTDATDLRRVEEIRTTVAVQEAVNNYFKERP